MNQIYKVLWNHATQNWVVASELARGQVKSATTHLTRQPSGESKLKKTFYLTTLSTAIIASLFSTSATAYSVNANAWDAGDSTTLIIGEKSDASGPQGGASAHTGERGTDTGIITSKVHHSIAIGGSANVTNTANALAIGFNAKVGDPTKEATKGSVALGAYSKVSEAHTSEDAKSITIGNKTYNYAGQASSGTSVLSIGSGAAVNDWIPGSRQHDGRGHWSDKIDKTATNNYNYRQIQNVAAGRVSEDSTDAINGSQLHALVQAMNTIQPSKAMWWLAQILLMLQSQRDLMAVRISP